MSERVINTWRDPYDLRFSTCRPKQIVIRSGLTVLVGCNGSGKTTLINNIESELKKNNIPCYYYSNLRDGGPSKSLSNAISENNLSLAAMAWSSSEGENITINLNNRYSQFQEFMTTGRVQTRFTRLQDAFGDTPYQIPETKERWILFDAIDSGYSIDNVIDLKNSISEMIRHFSDNGYELYVVVSANEFELAYQTPCMDVTNGKYMTFDTYDQFKKFIVASAKKKHKRDERVMEKNKDRDWDDYDEW